MDTSHLQHDDAVKKLMAEIEAEAKSMTRLDLDLKTLEEDVYSLATQTRAAELSTKKDFDQVLALLDTAISTAA